jgi:hypothetical protein
MDLVKLADDLVAALGKGVEMASRGSEIVTKVQAAIDDAAPKVVAILRTAETVLTDAGPVVDKLKPVIVALAPFIAMFAPQPPPAPKPAGHQ